MIAPVLEPDSVDVVSDLIRDVGSVAAALATIVGGVYVAGRFLLRVLTVRVRAIVEDATETLRPNGGSAVADLPGKLDALIVRVDQMEARQLEIASAVIRRSRGGAYAESDPVPDTDPGD